MMHLDRRTFIGTLGAASLAIRHLTAASIQKVGVQLYTVRDLMKQDFDGTLAKIAALGYKEVEFAGYFERTPAQVREALKKNGLTAPSTHVDYISLRDKLPSALETAKTIGHEYVVCPWLDEALRKEPDIYKRVAETLNKAGDVAHKSNIQIAYHNHHFEFAPVDGKTPYDSLLETCDPKLVKMEMDLCWTTVAKQDPLAYFKKYPGRFPLVHVKGLRKAPDAGASAVIGTVMSDITDVGGGGDTIDWKRIFAHSKEAGIKHYFVEHDVPKVPLESLKASYDYVKQLSF
jgi:sugar phosphate isomerase/epimerase